MDKLAAIRRPVEKELAHYIELFDEALSHKDDYLGTALAYVRQRRGKMMRPLLVLLVAREVGEVSLPALRSAVTLEILHTASLVHDDIVDESEERRGQASTNSKFGNKVAVLVGDYLLSQALHQSALTGSVRCVDILAHLGSTLSEGEVLQLANIRTEEFSVDAYYDVVRRKTAELFATCAQLGAISQGADDAFVEAARHLGEMIGMGFQIRDDIFDYYDDARIGKPTGNDMHEGKLTLPVLHVLSTTDDAELHAAAKRVRAGKASPADVSLLVEQTKERGGIDYARSVMDDFRTKALDDLAHFSNTEIKTALEGYVDYAIDRNI